MRPDVTSILIVCVDPADSLFRSLSDIGYQPARGFGRAGALHFDFRELVLPNGTQNVQASLTGADSAAGQNLALDSEGQVKPKPQDKLLVPFILLTLADRPLNHDRDDGNGFGQNAGASNSLGVIGFIVGTAARQRNIAAGLGYYLNLRTLDQTWPRCHIRARHPACPSNHAASVNATSAQCTDTPAPLDCSI